MRFVRRVSLKPAGNSPFGSLEQPCSGRGLPPSPVTWVGWALLPPSFHPYRAVKLGGIVSVALSLQLPAIAVSNRPALRCPDFPHCLMSSAIIS